MSNTPSSASTVDHSTSGTASPTAMASAVSSTASSRRSSISFNAVSGQRPVVAMAGPSAPMPMPTPAPSASTTARRRLEQTADPLSRNYPKPEREIDVAEALAREPPKWSLGYWARNARDLQTPSTSPNSTQQRLEEAKRQLRQAQSEMSAQLSANSRSKR